MLMVLKYSALAAVNVPPLIVTVWLPALPPMANAAESVAVAPELMVSVPVPMAPAPPLYAAPAPSTSVPSLTVMPPVSVFKAESVSVPEPALVST